MKTTKIISLIAVLAACICCKKDDRAQKEDEREVKPKAMGGVNDGNTGELTTIKNNPWFVGSRVATYCVKFGDHGASARDEKVQQQFLTQIDAAFARWKDILEALSPTTPGSSKVPNGEFLAGEAVANLTREFKRVSCTEDPEMQIKVGTWDDADTGFLKYTSRYTVAYALRTAYSEETGRSRGHIWLVADAGPQRYKGPAPEGEFWQQGAFLYNVVLHELGHVFGVEHMANTFMDSNFPAGVLATNLSMMWAGEDFETLRGFDHERCGLLLRMDGDDELSQLVKDFFGAEPSSVQSVCWRAAHDKKRPSDSNTPHLVWVEDKDRNRLAEVLLAVDGVYGSIDRISGNYLKKNASSDYEYQRVNHASLVKDLYRMRFERAGRAYWVELELAEAGVALFRVAYDGPWKSFAATLYPLEHLNALNSAIDAVRFDDDAVDP